MAALLSVVALVVPVVAQSGAAGPGTLVFIGTYTSPASKGIYVSRLDPSTGALSAPVLAAEGRNPSFLAASADGRFLYAINEVDAVDGKPGGAVTGYAIDKAAGTLKLLNAQSTVGGGPAHVSVAGRMVFAANYGGGSVAAYATDADGRLKPAGTFVQHKGSSANKARQAGPHAHAVTPDPSGTFLYAPDLGLDQVLIYRIDAAAGTIAPATPPFATVTPAGSGPRHIAISRDGKHAYVITEMLCTVVGYDRNTSTGALTQTQTISTLPAGEAVAPGYSTAELILHPSGRFLYGSNRGHDSLVVYGVDASTGKLTLLQHVPTGGKAPRAFNIDPTGAFLVAGNQNSDTVGVFKIDAAKGTLTATGHTISVGKPVSFEFVR
ncbi:MAG: lactonase family protein [Vicinamibacteraceae bacterium]